MIERQFRITIDRYQMLRPGDRVLVAVSGGPDSTALLALLRELAPGMRLDLHVAHLDHAWRGRSSAKDAEFVRRMALRHGLPVTVGRVQPSAWVGQGRRQSSREARGREIRRNFLLETARQIGARRVAVGHTRDDQAESFLLRLLRGAGSRGLAGTFPVVDGVIIRPLIELRRKDLVVYLKEQHLRYRLDPTNRDTSFTRNRVRRRLLPLLERQFNPAVVDALAQTADLLRDEDAYLGGVAEAEYRARASPRGGGVAFRAAALLELPPALRRRVLRLALAAVHGDLLRIEMGHVEQSLRLLEPPQGRRSVSLPDGLVVALRGDELLVRPRMIAADASGPAGDGSVCREALCPVPGEVPLLGFGITLRASILPREQDAAATPGVIHHAADPRGAADPHDAAGPHGAADLRGTADLLAATDLREAGRDTAYLDADLLPGPLLIRPRRPGDRFVPLGGPGSRKVKSFLIDRKVPVDERGRIPLVLSGERIAWVVGHAIDDRFKVTGATRRILVLQKESR